MNDVPSAVMRVIKSLFWNKPAVNIEGMPRLKQGRHAVHIGFWGMILSNRSEVIAGYGGGPGNRISNQQTRDVDPMLF